MTDTEKATRYTLDGKHVMVHLCFRTVCGVVNILKMCMERASVDVLLSPIHLDRHNVLSSESASILGKNNGECEWSWVMGWWLGVC